MAGDTPESNEMRSGDSTERFSDLDSVRDVAGMLVVAALDQATKRMAKSPDLLTFSADEIAEAIIDGMSNAGRDAQVKVAAGIERLRQQGS